MVVPNQESADEPRPRRRRASSPTRDRILAEAFALFVERGFSGTTISEIERRVGLAVGTGSLNYHFKTKNELLRAAVEREVATRMAEVEAARRDFVWPEDAREQQIAAAALVLQDIRRFNPLFRLLETEGKRVSDLQRLVVAALADLGGLGEWTQQSSRLLLIAALIGFDSLRRTTAGAFDVVSDEDFVAALIDALPMERPVGFPPNSPQQATRKGSRKP